MVRGNWQKRVETAETRRREAKQRKQKSEDKKLHKGQVQELLRLLDRNSDGWKKLMANNNSKVIHIWTDTLPSDSVPFLDIVEHEEYHGSNKASSKRRQRSDSIQSEGGGTGSGRKGRGRSNSMPDGGGSSGKKKVHPRSKEAAEQTHHNDGGGGGDVSDLFQPLLCRSHYFMGKCEETGSTSSSRHGKKGQHSCRYLHYSKQHKTLYQVLTGGCNGPSKQRELTSSEEAAMKVISDEMLSSDQGAVEMMYHVPLNIKEIARNEDSVEQSFSEHLLDILAEKNIRQSNVVLLAIDDILVFDRNRDGVIITEDDFLMAVVGGTGNAKSRTLSMGSEGDDDDVEHLHETVSNLPGTLLEQILTYLPDSAVAAACRVCRHWHHEIGQNSPNLWKHLLERRNWPMVSGAEKDVVLLQDDASVDTNDTGDTHREIFKRHYIATRDLAAIKLSLSAIENRRAGVEEKEMCYLDFSRRKNLPSFPNSCVGVQVWSPNRILVAYAQDCSLRLFEAVGKAGNDEKQCRELICQRVDPYLKTKKRSCNIICMDLDEECMGCLCKVMADSLDAEAYILVVMSRDDFLLGESSAAAESGGACDNAQLKVIDIGEAVLHYMLSSDVGDHRLLELIDYLSDGGEIGRIDVVVSKSMAACGYGRFLVELSISIPMLNDDGGEVMHELDRKLVLFSAGIGAIVWAGDSHPMDRRQAFNGSREDEMTLACLRRPNPGGPRAACNLAIGSASSLSVSVAEILPAGHVQAPRTLESSMATETSIAEDQVLTAGWEFLRQNEPDEKYRRPILVSSTDIITADNMIRRVPKVQHKTVVTFFPRFPAVDEPGHAMIVLDGTKVLRMVSIRDEHVILLSRHTSTEEEAEDLDLGGQWFGGNNDNDEVGLVAVLLHVRSRREIDRVVLPEPPTTTPEQGQVPEISVHSLGTIAIGLCWKGVAMTGDDVRSLNDVKKFIVLGDNGQAGCGGSNGSWTASSGPSTPSKKKKAKRKTANKNNKKDGFARGMSLRG